MIFENPISKFISKRRVIFYHFFHCSTGLIVIPIITAR